MKKTESSALQFKFSFEQCCGTVMIYYGSDSGFDYRKVSVPALDPDPDPNPDPDSDHIHPF
jgi:hypothetical protein